MKVPLPILVSTTAASILVLLALVTRTSPAEPQYPVREATQVSKTPPPLPATWHTLDSTFTECIESEGPAAKLDSLNAADYARTQDVKDAYGRVVKVEVIVDIGGGQQAVNVYYREKATCEAGLYRYQNLADQYR